MDYLLDNNPELMDSNGQARFLPDPTFHWTAAPQFAQRDFSSWTPHPSGLSQPGGPLFLHHHQHLHQHHTNLQHPPLAHNGVLPPIRSALNGSSDQSLGWGPSPLPMLSQPPHFFTPHMPLQSYQAAYASTISEMNPSTGSHGRHDDFALVQISQNSGPSTSVLPPGRNIHSGWMTTHEVETNGLRSQANGPLAFVPATSPTPHRSIHPRHSMGAPPRGLGTILLL